MFASFYRDRAIRHCLKFEYFDCLTNSQKCSKLLKVSEGVHEGGRLEFLQATQPVAFHIMLDCYLYSSISYIKLKQFAQAVNLTTEIINCWPHDDTQKCSKCSSSVQSEDDDLDDDCNPVFMQALALRARAEEKLGNLDQALIDIELARRVDKGNQVIEKAFRHITKRLADKKKKISKSIKTLTKKPKKLPSLKKSSRIRAESFDSDREEDGSSHNNGDMFDDDIELIDVSSDEEAAKNDARSPNTLKQKSTCFSSVNSDESSIGNIHEILLIHGNHPSQIQKLEKLDRLKHQSHLSLVRQQKQEEQLHASEQSPKSPKKRQVSALSATPFSQQEACLLYLQSLGIKNKSVNNILQQIFVLFLQALKRIRNSRRIQVALMIFFGIYMYLVFRTISYLKSLAVKHNLLPLRQFFLRV